MMSGVNILDALALAYKAIKDLVAKKPPKPSAPSYQKVSVPVVRLLPDDCPAASPSRPGPPCPCPPPRPSS